MAAIFVDAMIRYQTRRLSRRSARLKLALTCGEETPNDFDGAKYLAENHRELIDAEFAINEGGGGMLGSPRRTDLQRRAGGRKGLSGLSPRDHESRRTFVASGEDNAIYRLAAALTKISQLPISDRAQRHDAALLRTYGGRSASGTLAADMKRDHEKASGRGGAGAHHDRSELQLDPAHHLCRDDARRRPCAERAAAARRRERELSDLSGALRRKPMRRSARECRSPIPASRSRSSIAAGEGFAAAAADAGGPASDRSSSRSRCGRACQWCRAWRPVQPTGVS